MSRTRTRERTTAALHDFPAWGHPSDGEPGRRLAGVLALRGALALIFGVLLLVWPGLIFLRPVVGAVALATVLGVYALVAGVALLTAAWRVRNARPIVPIP
jgi:uncharacterized membrane protein HdeD (DUF308 family)